MYNTLSPCLFLAILVASVSSRADIFSSNTYAKAAFYGYIVFALWIVLYPIMALTATYIFQRKLLALAKKQAVSSTNVTKEIELSDHQQNLIAVAAYVLSTTGHRAMVTQCRYNLLLISAEQEIRSAVLGCFVLLSFSILGRFHDQHRLWRIVHAGIVHAVGYVR